jgi:ABC-2 type transport system ATP-binding protein
VNGLDPAGIVEVRELLLELVHLRGVTVFMSSHLLSEVARIATRIGVIHEGRLIEELDAAELERRRRRWLVVDARDRSTAQAILQATGFAVAAREDGKLALADAHAVACPDDVARLLVERHVRLTRLSVEQEDLESYFLRLIGAARGGEQ